MKFRKGVFISYSHRDTKWLNELRTTLAPIEKYEGLSVWDDRALKPGDDWAREIEKSLNEARVAVLLVSPNSLASRFITEVELPILLDARSKGLRFLWVLISDSAWRATPLKAVQGATDPMRPIDALPPAKRNAVWLAVANKIQAAMDLNAIGNALQIVDAFATGEDPASKPSVVATQNDGRISFQQQMTKNEVERITAEEFETLSEDARQFIQTHERAMKILYDRWSEVYPNRVAANPTVRSRALNELADLEKEMCAELGEILDFINQLGKSLHDHYEGVRRVCRKLLGT